MHSFANPDRTSAGVKQLVGNSIHVAIVPIHWMHSFSQNSDATTHVAIDVSFTNASRLKMTPACRRHLGRFKIEGFKIGSRGGTNPQARCGCICMLQASAYSMKGTNQVASDLPVSCYYQKISNC